MAQYSNFFDAYMAQNSPKPTPAQTTWTPQAYQNLTNAWIGQGNAPTAQMQTQLDPTTGAPYAPKPPVFDPMNDPAYAAATGTYGYTDASGYHPGTLVQHAQNEADYQGHNIGQRTGYDASGHLITGGADLNPYAQAAILKRSYDNNVRGTNNSYAAQGQLYSGARQNAQNANDWNYGVSSDQLQRAASDAYHGQQLNVQNATDQSTAALLQYFGPAFQAWLAQQKGS